MSAEEILERIQGILNLALGTDERPEAGPRIVSDVTLLVAQRDAALKLLATLDPHSASLIRGGGGASPPRLAVDLPIKDPMFLARLLSGEVHRRLLDAGDTKSRTGASWLSRRAVDPRTGASFISVQLANEWMTQPCTGWLPKVVMEALATLLFDGQTDIVYIANAISIGLGAPRVTGSSFVATMPAWLDRFTPAEKELVRAYVYLMGRAKGLTS